MAACSARSIPKSSRPPSSPAKDSDLKPGYFAATARANLTFEERYVECRFWVERRRRNFDLANLPWDDVRQLVLIRISQQYHIFDPVKGEFRRWVNRVISNCLNSIYRDYYSKSARPCVTGKGGCSENMGGNLCRRTPSGVQCSECPAYKDWELRKGDHHAISLPLPLDNHSQEVHSKQSDFMDIEATKRVIDEKMREKLTRGEYKMYRLLLIKHLPEEEVARQMGFKKRKGKSGKMFEGYLTLLAARHRFVEMAKQIIAENDLA